MAAAAATAAELPSVVQVKSNGFLKLGPAELSVRCFNDKWATAKWEMDAARIGRQGGSASGTMWFGEIRFGLRKRSLRWSRPVSCLP